VKFSELANAVHSLRISNDTSENIASNAAIDPEIGSIHYRAQDVQSGGLFVAVPGMVADGHDYVDIAIENGAAAIVCQKPVATPVGIAKVTVENTRAALAALSARFYGHPSEKMVTVGITGTNGKTTTTYLIEKILEAAGQVVGVIGTINYRFDGKEFDNSVTTPESFDLQQILAKMHAGGVSHAVLEVSSHALDMHRVDSCWFDVGAFTNLTQDHLDYHKDMESYWSCKKRLFSEILISGPKKRQAVAVINDNDPRGKELLQIPSLKKISYGNNSVNDVRPEKTHSTQEGISGKIRTGQGEFDFHSHLVGAHNQENILCAAAVGLALNIPQDKIKAGIENVTNIPGRLEAIPNTHHRYVFVDYAHTPDALQNVIVALNAVATKKLICVFGCGGDRDRAKRPIMGEIAASRCDLSIITSDNPRSEPPLDIIGQILTGVRKVCKKQYQPSELLNGFKQRGVAVEPDRKSAIRLAVAASRPGDTVLIAGKGHETYQILGDKTIAFDDRKEALKALSADRLASPTG
jgi:UDP-N-acetylmuramoyl-L-alanyl-D-glutamate--2,6-diaminopimelate ligase/murE/murF fusion protein